MKRTYLSAAAFAAVATAGIALTLAPAEPAEARKVVQSGAINGGQIRFCENQSGDRWQTFHAPTDETYFSQEIVLGEGSYSIAMVPNGNFRFNAFVYEGDGQRYIGGARDVRNYVQRVKAGSFGEKYLVQLVKTTNTCRGCSVTMSLRAFNCPVNKPRTPTAHCPRNQCYQPPSSGIFGISPTPGRCIARRGANGGICGTSGN